MCVAITLEPGDSLTVQEIEKMDRANADGVGIAWAYDGVVSWYKTTKVDAKEISDKIYYWQNYPRLVHFRFATVGGTRPDLCHPFEVGPLASCTPTGSSQLVMIHNGHWGRWDEVHSLLKKENLLPDAGPWSDSRLAAYLAHTDRDWFEALGGRVATLAGDGTIQRLGDWQELRKGIMVSNKGWDTDYQYSRGGYSGYRSWKGWKWNDDEVAAFEKELADEAKKDEDRRAQIAAAAKSKHKKRKKGEAKESARGQYKSGKYFSSGVWKRESDGKWYTYDQNLKSVVEVAFGDTPSPTTEAGTGEVGAGGAGEATPLVSDVPPVIEFGGQDSGGES